MKNFLSVILLLLNIFYKCFTASDEPDLSEEKRNFAEKSEEEGEILKNILNIDTDLQQELENPTAPDVSFEIQLKTLKFLVAYYNRLKEVYDGVEENIPKKLNVASELLKAGGPGFVKKDIDEEKLTKVYNWDEESLDFYKDYVNDIKLLWLNTTTILNARQSQS